MRAAILGAALGVAGLPLAAAAQVASTPAASNGPMDISADNGTFDNATCVSTWSGAAEVLQVFDISKVGRVAGCRVREGVVRRGARVRIIRQDVVVLELGTPRL